LKLNIACGKQTWPEFFCVDAVAHQKATRPPDLLHAFEFDGTKLSNPLPLDDGCADELHSYHFLEHVYRWQAPALLREFHRLLKDGGRLILELPNIEAAARNLLAGMPDQMCMWAFYGNPDERDTFMCHRWGYTPNSVKALLTECGFRSIAIKPPKTHGERINRDMRIECVK
jgi:SAM-dependent methyltransferase